MLTANCQRLSVDLGEPTLGELLSDPICRLLMRSDGITSTAVLALLGQIRTTGLSRQRKA
jgi:hypothetical protein